MRKWYGVVGYAIAEEKSPGVWVNDIEERHYYGDIIRNFRRLDSKMVINDDVNINNEISIVSDPYANKNFHAIRYVEFMGSKWKVTGVEAMYPRLILTVGGVYNE